MLPLLDDICYVRGPLFQRVRESVKDWVDFGKSPRIFLSFFNSFRMKNFKNILYSKKFWTLLASIVAALSAFFVVSCSSTYRTAQTFLRYEGPDSSRYTLIFDQSGSVKNNKTR